MSIKALIRSLVNKLGYDIQKYPDHGVVPYYLKTLDIDAVIDIGANEGQYAQSLRAGGYRGRIISFEPLSKPFRNLEAKCRNDSQWQSFNLGIGDEDKLITINVSESSVFSSLLQIGDYVKSIQPTSIQVTTEQISIRRFDSIYEQLHLNGNKVWLKSDTQGYEMNVLKGLGCMINEVVAMQLELSLIPIYQGQPTMNKVIEYLNDCGFVVSDFIRGFCNGRCGPLIEIDGIFVRNT